MTAWLVVWLLAADGGVSALPPVEVRADRLPAPQLSSPALRDPSGSLSVRTAEGALASASDVSALASSVPGVVLQDAGGPGQRKTLSVRGAAPNAVVVLLDGIPLAPSGNALDLSRLPISAVDRIELLRGGASARYGPGALGGVLNVVTRTPDGQPRLFATLSQGSFVTTQLSAGATGSIAGGEGLLLLHGLRSDGTFRYLYDPLPATPDNALEPRRRLNNDALQGGGLARFGRRFGSTQLDVLLEGLVERRGLAGPIQNPSTVATQQTERGLIGIRTHSTLPTGSTLGALAFGRLEDLALGTGASTTDFRQLDAATGLELVFSHLFSGRHALTLLGTGGAEWLVQPAGSHVRWGRYGVMGLFEELFFDGVLSVNASVRLDGAGRFVVVSPKAGVLLELPRGVSLRANLGQASRTPSFSELYVVQGTLLPNPDLRPERALTADLSASATHRLGSLTVTGFASLYEDLISYEYFPPNLARPFNFQAARVAGVEVEGSFTPAQWLRVDASYTFLDSQNLRDDPRYYLKALPFRPRHRVTARLEAGPTVVRGRVEVVAQSSQFTNRTQTVELPARAFLNFGLTVTPSTAPRVSVSAELKNALDVHAQDVDGYPLPPRSFFLTLGVAWEPGRKT